MTAPFVLELGVGRYQIGGNPVEWPPRMHFYRCDHDKPTGAVVPPGEGSDDTALTIVFHNRETVDAMIKALEITKAWFAPRGAIDARLLL